MLNPDSRSILLNFRSGSQKDVHENIAIQNNVSNAIPIVGEVRPKDCLFGRQMTSEPGQDHDSTEARKTNSKFPNVISDRSNNIQSDSAHHTPECSDRDSDIEDSEENCSDAQKLRPVEQETETNSQHDPPCNEFSIQDYFKDCSIGVLTFLIIAFYVGVIYRNDEEGMVNKPYNFIEDFERVQKLFNEQDEDFWRSIRVDVEEVLELKQPRVIIFLYKSDSMAIAKNIIANVSKAAVCHLSDCSQEPIDIEGSILNTTELQDDFGSIVSNYRERLENSGVFIIQNLQLVPGKSAQALHLFCDEYNPVVKRALFLFTVKIDELNELPDKYSAIPFLEGLLLNVWDDIGVHDKFDPLFTRISGTILSVLPQ